MLRGLLLAATVAVLAAAPAAADQASSLYHGPGQRPGPDLLYEPPASAPQLENRGPWKAAPILVSGATAYRDGEFLYQDFLYDDSGANSGTSDPGDPRTQGNTFSRQNGTYTYPTDPAYAGNAADLVELRVKPLSDSTVFRLTLNTLKDPSVTAATIAIASPGDPSRPFPHGANATGSALLFLTWHGDTAELVDAATGLPAGTATASVDSERRQIELSVPKTAWDPTGKVVRLTAGVGLWDRDANAYLLPQGSADATHPGGAGSLPAPAAFFNVAFRTEEPTPAVSDVAATVTNPAWWRDQQQGSALKTGDLSAFHADVDFTKLAAGTSDDSGVPRTGALDRILASHFETAQGVDYSSACGAADQCKGELRGRLLPYAIYVPKKPAPIAGYGLTLQLHSLGAGYNQYLGSRNQSQFGERGDGSIVVTPTGRGPDGWYYDYAGADTFEVWADVASKYNLNPSDAVITGYSMGGYGTYKFATQFPDLFAKGQPTVGPPGLGIWVPPGAPTGGESTNSFDQLASLRNVPFLIWVEATDELVPIAGTQTQARGFDDLGLRYEFDTFTQGDHLTLALNDQFQPAADFLGTTKVDRDPPHVTYVYNPSMDFPALGTAAGHAYWVSGVALRDSGANGGRGQVDVRSEGFGAGDPTPSGTQPGAGALTGGTLPAIAYTSQSQTWGPAPKTAVADKLVLTATNTKDVTVDVGRAKVSCNPSIDATSDGPITVHFEGCNGRSVTIAAANACAASAGFASVSARGRGRGVAIGFARNVKRPVSVDVFRSSEGRHVVRERLVARFTGRVRSFVWNGHANRKGRSIGDGLYFVRLKVAGRNGRVDTRRVTLRSVDGRFGTRPSFYRRASCGLLTSFKLERPAFGGPSNTPLGIAYQLGAAARVTIHVTQGKRNIATFNAGSRQAHKTNRLRLAAKGLTRGDSTVRISVQTGGRTLTSVLVARRL